MYILGEKLVSGHLPGIVSDIKLIPEELHENNYNVILALAKYVKEGKIERTNVKEVLESTINFFEENKFTRKQVLTILENNPCFLITQKKFLEKLILIFNAFDHHYALYKNNYKIPIHNVDLIYSKVMYLKENKEKIMNDVYNKNCIFNKKYNISDEELLEKYPYNKLLLEEIIKEKQNIVEEEKPKKALRKKIIKEIIAGVEHDKIIKENNINQKKLNYYIKAYCHKKR
jgi:hypothetical protein